jgi:hypothetical protein
MLLAICGVVVLYGGVGEFYAILDLYHQREGPVGQFISAPGALALTVIAAAGPARVYIKAFANIAARSGTVTWRGQPTAPQPSDREEPPRTPAPDDADSTEPHQEPRPRCPRDSIRRPWKRQPAGMATARPQLTAGLPSASWAHALLRSLSPCQPEPI